MDPQEKTEQQQQQDKRQFSAFEDIGRVFDRELQRLIDFVNDRVVPSAREDSETLLRRAAQRLDKLADRLAENRRSAPPGPQGSTEQDPQAT